MSKVTSNRADKPAARKAAAATPGERAQRVAHALAYPFAQPGPSFVFAGGQAFEIVELPEGELARARVRAGDDSIGFDDLCRAEGLAAPTPLAERIPVIAHGSNAAPGRLAEKFGGAAEGAIIPVLRAQLEDFDVVYAPHFSAYGSIPATLEHSPGTRVEISVTYLTPDQVAAMDVTEIRAVGPTYARGTLGAIRCHLDGQGVLSEAQVYLAKRGSLQFEGAPRAFAALGAQGRRFETRSQPDKQARARDALAPAMELDAFVHENIHDEARRSRHNEALLEWAVGFSYEQFEIIEG
jgi:hypothetical protein